METDSQGLTDIGRRKIITELLNIPPMLFGVAVLKDVTLVEHPQVSLPVVGGQTVLHRVKTDIEKYEADLRTRWKLYAISDAGDAIPAIDADIQQLEQLTKDAKGDFLARVQELLFGNYFLASAIRSHKRQFSDASSYADHAVRVAKALDDPDLVATALWFRGWFRLVTGLYGTFNERGIFSVKRTLLEDAARDFEEAKKNAHPQLKGLILLGWGHTQLHLDKDYSPLDTLNKAARLVGKDTIDDPYTRQLIVGTHSGFHEGRYLTDSATLLNAAGDPIEALSYIESLKKLDKDTYSREERPKKFAWIDIIAAESYLRMRDYDQATKLAKFALEVCLGLRDIANIAIIRDLYGRLLSTSYGKSTQVRALGEMLKKGSKGL